MVLAAFAGGCGQASVPDRPSWDQDVFPILQGSCNHCHGASRGEKTDASPMGEALPVGRLDVCDTAPFIAALGAIPGFVGGALAESGGFEDNLKAIMRRPRAAMPPAPAPELSDYDRDVLFQWRKIVVASPSTACNKQTRNRDPKAELISRVVDAGDLVVTVEVSDPDRDQVLGKVASGTAEQLILSTGRRSFRFAGLTMDAPIKVTLLDGYAPAVEVNF
jgi:hypothetical protein